MDTNTTANELNNQPNPAPITGEDIKALCGTLRIYKKSWVKLLSDYIKKQHVSFTEYTPQKVYNIYYGITTNQDDRMIFMKYGLELLDKYKGENKEVTDRMKRVFK